MTALPPAASCRSWPAAGWMSVPLADSTCRRATGPAARQAKKLRNAADCHLADGEEQQLVPDIKGAREGQLALDHSLAQGIGDFHLPDPGHNNAIVMRFQAPKRRIRVCGCAVGETPHQRIRSVVARLSIPRMGLEIPTAVQPVECMPRKQQSVQRASNGPNGLI